MRAGAAVLTLLLLCVPASAAGWTAGMVEDEGGPVMMASVLGEGGDVPPELIMMCAGSEGVNLRYGMGSGPGENVEMPMGEYPFTFSFGAESATISMQYEGMDGAYAAYVPPTDPVIALLKSGTTVSVNDPTGVYREVTFPLQGSAKAIDTVLAACD